MKDGIEDRETPSCDEKDALIGVDGPTPLRDALPPVAADVSDSLPNAASWQRLLRGPGGIMASSLALAVMNFLVKLASIHFPAGQITFSRFAFGAVVLGGLGLSGTLDIRARNHRLLITRGLLGSCAIVLLFLAISRTRLTNAILLANTYVLFGAVFSYFVLNEGFGLRIGGALLVALIGAGFVVRPELKALHSGDLLALAHGVMGGAAITVVRGLRRAGNESPWGILFYLSIIGMPAGIVSGLFIEHQSWPIPHGTGLLLLLSIGLFGTLGQGLLTYAYRWCTTAEGGILSLLVVPISSGLGMIFLGERLAAWDWVGASLIMLSSIYVLAPIAAMLNLRPSPTVESTRR